MSNEDWRVKLVNPIVIQPAHKYAALESWLALFFSFDPLAEERLGAAGPLKRRHKSDLWRV